MRKAPINRSFLNAFRGIAAMIGSERNFQIEIFALLINLLMIVYLKLDPSDMAIILICCFTVLSAEIMNTCIEKICDMVQPELDFRIKFIKDAAAGAVLLLALMSVFAALLIYPKYFTGLPLF